MKHQQKFYTTNQIDNNENFRKFREIREHLTCQRLIKVSLIRSYHAYHKKYGIKSISLQNFELFCSF